MNKLSFLGSVVLAFALVACQSSTKYSERNPAQSSQGTGEIGSVENNYNQVSSYCKSELIKSDLSEKNIRDLFEERKISEGEFNILEKTQRNARTSVLMNCFMPPNKLSDKDMDLVRDSIFLQCSSRISTKQKEIADREKENSSPSMISWLKENLKYIETECKNFKNVVGKNSRKETEHCEEITKNNSNNLYACLMHIRGDSEQYIQMCKGKGRAAIDCLHKGR